MPNFLPGLLLNERFFADAVRPILAARFPALRYSAALIGYGSDVLGYDTPRSTDHEWGPRLVLFVAEPDAPLAPAIHDALRHDLPTAFLGYSTHFGPPDHEGVRLPAPPDAGPIDHKVEIHTVRRFFLDRFGIDPEQELAPADWLLLPQQKLLEATAGRVYHDGLGALDPIRARLAFYPRDVWLYLLACQWRRIAQQEAFVGRAGEVGDDLGSRLLAAALARDLMALCFLLERHYAPYSKWFGTAFARLPCAPAVTPHLDADLRADTWPERETHLAAAYETAARLQNALALTPPLDPRPSRYHARPFTVIHGDRFAAALTAAIDDPAVRAIVDRAGYLGSVDQLSDNVDLRSDPAAYAKLRSLYLPSATTTTAPDPG